LKAVDSLEFTHVLNILEQNNETALFLRLSQSVAGNSDKLLMSFFNVLLSVHLSIILVTDRLNAQIFDS